MNRAGMLVVGLAFLVGCAGSEAGEAAEEAMPPAGISLADMAGTWSGQAMNAAGDSTLATYEMVATATEEGWQMIFAGMDPIPMRILMVDGDSVVSETGPYSSALREGLEVTTRTVSRLQDGMMMGSFTASYSDGSTLEGTTHATRKQ